MGQGVAIAVQEALVSSQLNQQQATLIAALMTGTVAFTVGILAYVFGRIQKEHEVQF